MKNKMIFGLISIILIIGFVVLGCKDDNTEAAKAGVLDGTWNKAPQQLIISGNNWSMKVSGADNVKGTATINDTAKTLKIVATHYYVAGSWQAIPSAMEADYTANVDYDISGNTLTFSNNDNETNLSMNGTWSK